MVLILIASILMNVHEKEKRAELGLNDHTPLLLAVGRLTEAKDYSNMLQAFALIDSLAVQPRLAIAGVGELGSQLEAEAERLGVSARVHSLVCAAIFPSSCLLLICMSCPQHGKGFHWS